MFWHFGDGEQFKGALDIITNIDHLYTKAMRHRQKATVKKVPLGHSLSKANKRYTLAQAQALFGSDRSSIEEAYPGDVIGINNPGNFAIGDTLYTGNQKVAFEGIPLFSREIFSYIKVKI